MSLKNSKKIKIQFGTANFYKKGFINCDLNDVCGKIDKKVDMNNFPYPFQDNFADLIIHEHTLEHLEYPESALEEMRRILKKDASMIFIIPYKSLYGRVHKYSFDYSYFKSYNKNLINVFGRIKPRNNNWNYAEGYWDKVTIQFGITSIYKKIFGFGLLCFFVNRLELTKKIYDVVLSEIIKFDYMKIKMVK
jgi:SAM-dependent methyltransferase